jgi:hypothetical protein
VIQRSTNSGGPYTIIAGTTDTVYTDTSAVNGRTYYYVVAAVNSFGLGPVSTEAVATPYTLAVWLKADAIAGLGDGAAVSTWNDLSGNGNNATQAVASQRPVFVSNAINSLPAVHFNAPGANYLSFNRPVQDDFTIFCVYRSSQGVGTGTAFYNGAGLISGEVGGVVNDFGLSLNANGFLLAGTGNPDSTIVASGSNYNDGQPHLVTFKRTRSTGALALYVDGHVVGTATGGTQSLGSPQRLVLGAQQTLVSFLTGDIAEVKIFNASLTDTARGVEENALRQKYAIAIPALGVAASGGMVTLFWPDWAAAWQLWSTTNLLPSASWSLVTNSPQDVNGYQTVIVPVAGPMRFFRLRGP